MDRESTTPMIITFKKKDQRTDKKLDKQAILRKHVKTRMEFCDVLSLQDMASVPSDFEESPTGMDINIYELPIISGRFSQKEIKALRKDDNIEMIEEDVLAYAVQSPHDIPAHGTPELMVEDSPAMLAETLPWGVNRIDAERAWEVTRGAGIRVAVLDTGIDHLHRDLAPNFGGGVSFVPGESFTDGNGHGTHVAGIIGARQNGTGVVGVAPNCSLYSVKVLDRSGRGQYSSIISGILWCARNNIDVINMSLGGGQHVQALQNACDFAFSRNVLIVAAAGNNGPNPDSVGYPGRYDSCIAVSSIDDSGNVPSFSSRGNQVDLAAPGVNILSTWPGNRYERLNGTSMAAPHVAGTAALATSSHRFTRATTIREILLQAADNLGVPGRDDETGHGLVDAEQSAYLRTLH